ncbi:hypothetical protein CSPHI_03425 [Corynebacterium sphenisci DSM 44792]|uniref:Uncharacterized protein n=1 Tax=Corynebacterium sphenisci DSM 44792 TaxID=1437874 RepID=A0A1L7CWU9_9CORY|nr:hypothetical protein [Corynebacterium sphenisci]APT90277.1 hypothetical protein CSPHI_03425 [Corynebacterium sphenisci DSM 44792]
MRHDRRIPRPPLRPARGLLTAMALLALALAGCAGGEPGTADPGEVGETVTTTTRQDAADGAGTARDTAAGSAEESPAAGELAFETAPRVYYAGDTVILGDPYPPMNGRPALVAWRLAGAPDPAGLRCTVTVREEDGGAIRYEGEAEGPTCLGDEEQEAFGDSPLVFIPREGGDYVLTVTVTEGGAKLVEVIPFEVHVNSMSST